MPSHKMAKFPVLCLLAWVLFVPVTYGQDTPEGIRPLFILEKPIRTVIPSEVTFINDPKIVEDFMTKLEKHLPDWKYLYGRTEMNDMIACLTNQKNATPLESAI